MRRDQDAMRWDFHQGTQIYRRTHRDKEHGENSAFMAKRQEREWIVELNGAEECCKEKARENIEHEERYKFPLQKRARNNGYLMQCLNTVLAELSN